MFHHTITTLFETSDKIEIIGKKTEMVRIKKQKAYKLKIIKWELQNWKNITTK